MSFCYTRATAERRVDVHLIPFRDIGRATHEFYSKQFENRSHEVRSRDRNSLPFWRTGQGLWQSPAPQKLRNAGSLLRI
jgi:hypothetical protein